MRRPFPSPALGLSPVGAAVVLSGLLAACGPTEGGDPVSDDGSEETDGASDDGDSGEDDGLGGFPEGAECLAPSSHITLDGASAASVSPSGCVVAFLREQHLFVMPADGSSEAEVTNWAVSAFEFSADGSLVYRETGGERRLIRAAEEGYGGLAVLDSGVSNFWLASDADRVLYVRAEQGGAHQGEIRSATVATPSAPIELHPDARLMPPEGAMDAFGSYVDDWEPTEYREDSIWQGTGGVLIVVDPIAIHGGQVPSGDLRWIAYDGSTEHQLADHGRWVGSHGPSGRIVFNVWDGTSGWPTDVRALDTTTGETLAIDVPFPITPADEDRWSLYTTFGPSGRHVAFSWRQFRESEEYAEENWHTFDSYFDFETETLALPERALCWAGSGVHPALTDAGYFCSAQQMSGPSDFLTFHPWPHIGGETQEFYSRIQTRVGIASWLTARTITTGTGELGSAPRAIGRVSVDAGGTVTFSEIATGAAPSHTERVRFGETPTHAWMKVDASISADAFADYWLDLDTETYGPLGHEARPLQMMGAGTGVLFDGPSFGPK